MPSPAEVYSRLFSSLGTERAGAILRRLLHVPGALDWLTEETVALAVSNLDAAVTSPAPAALLAATGHAGLDDLPEPWPPAIEARRVRLLEDDFPAGEEPLSADDVLILVGEILRADRSGGAKAVLALLQTRQLDWRAPLACAWTAMDDRLQLARSLVTSPVLPALIVALRSNSTDAEAARALCDSAGPHLPRILARLISDGDIGFSRLVAEAGSSSSSPEPMIDPVEDGTAGPRLLESSLHAAWESKKKELASLTDALAAVAESNGDQVSAVEARRQALQLEPSDGRLSELTLSLVRAGDVARALEMLPPTPQDPSLQLAAGMAFVAGGALDKGRALLAAATEEAPDSVSSSSLDALASSLAAAGETALAVEALRIRLDRSPADSLARIAYAQFLLDSGDPDAALAEALLAGILDPGLNPARQIEADSLIALGRPTEALPILKSIGGTSGLASWRRMVSCAMDAGQKEEVQQLLGEPPDGIDAAEIALYRARGLTAVGNRQGATEVLQDAILENPAASHLWIALADSQGDPEASGETLRRAAQMSPGDPGIQSALARRLRLQARASEAYDAAAKALELDPNNTEANFEAGVDLLSLGRPSEARDHLRSAFRDQPSRFDVRLFLARAFEANGELESARGLFSHMPESAPAAAWFTSGRLALQGAGAANPAEAKVAASRLLRSRALGFTDPTLDFWLGKAFERSNDPARAARAYGDFLEAGPADSSEERRNAAVSKAHCLLSAGDTIEAVRDFEALRKTREEDPEILRPLARAYLDACLTDEAQHTAESLLRSNPEDQEALGILGSVARTTGEWKSVSKALRMAAERKATDPVLWIEAGEASLRAGSPEEARVSVAQSLGAFPDVHTRRRAALALVDLGEAAQAAKLLEEVALVLPEDSSVWIELADVSARAGDHGAEVEALSRVAALTPRDAEVHARSAVALWSLGRHAESLAAWQRAHDQSREDPRIHAGFARALIANGEVQAGLNEFAEALRLHPSDAQLLTEAGLATLRYGSAKEAVELLQSASGSDPLGVQALVGLGEAWLRLRQPDRAAQALRSACESPSAGTSAWALMAEAALSLGDLHAAQEAISQARRFEATETTDRISLARVEMRIGNWKDALTALTPVLAAGDPVGEAALADVVLRISEARWLYGEASEAARHSPSLALPGDSLSAWLDSRVQSPAGSTSAGRICDARLRLTRPQGVDDEALAGLQSACGDAEVSDEVVEALAIAFLSRRRPHDALEVLKQIQPDMLGASWQAVLAGLAHLQIGNPSVAERAFEDAAQDAGLRPLALALLGRAHLARGEGSEAIAALNEAVAQWPDEPAWQARLASLYLEEGSLDSALPHLQTASELAPENGAVRLALARALRDGGHFSEALNAFERVLPHAPAQAEVWHETGEAAMACGDSARAESCFDRAASLAPGEPKHLMGAANAAVSAGKLREARGRAEAALRLAGNDPAALQCLAAVVARQGDADRALELLNRAMAAAPDPAPVRIARCRLLIDIGRATVAASELRDHLAVNPDDEEGWRTLAEALEETGDLAEASLAVDHALRLAPRSSRLHVRQARISRKSGHLDRALAELRRAEELDPLDPELALEMGQVYEARREFDHALQAYQRAAEVRVHSAEPYRRAAAVLKSLKAYADAGRMLERAAALDPSDTTTLQQLAAVRALELVHGANYATAVMP